MNSNDPLHGITLERLLTEMVERHGWDELGYKIRIRCFNYDPSIKSSLAFLRRTPWARKKLEDWYVWEWQKEQRRLAKLEKHQEPEMEPENAPEPIDAAGRRIRREALTPQTRNRW